jgi:hypothetical protein
MERRSSWDTPGERFREFVGRLMMVFAEFGASFHPAAAQEFYAYREHQQREQQQIEAWKQQLETATVDDFKD